MKLRIATYNLFEGASASYNRLVEFVRASDIDVLCLQEINGWQDADAQRMRDFTDRGLFVQYAYGNSNTPYKLGTFSKLEFSKTDAYIEGYWHCVVETRITLPGGQQLAILNVHLDPWQEASRVRELDRLLRTIDCTVPTILTGDLNSLSRRDGYGPQMLGDMQRRGITKYGRNELEFGVSDYLEQAGFIDLAAQLGHMQPTVPTASTQDKDHEVPVRIDYLYATPDVAQFVRRAEVVVNDLTNTISDHYPLVIDFEIASTAGPISGDVADPPAQPQPTPVTPEPPTPPEPTKPAGPATVQHDEDGTVFVINHDD
jgi:exodeoxyribonuclease III